MFPYKRKLIRFLSKSATRLVLVRNVYLPWTTATCCLHDSYFLLYHSLINLILLQVWYVPNNFSQAWEWSLLGTAMRYEEGSLQIAKKKLLKGIVSQQNKSENLSSCWHIRKQATHWLKPTYCRVINVGCWRPRHEGTVFSADCVSGPRDYSSWCSSTSEPCYIYR